METRTCARCRAEQPRANFTASPWCRACHAAYNRARKEAIDEGTWAPSGRASYPTEADRVAARRWRAKDYSARRAEAALARQAERAAKLRAEADALRAGFRRGK